MTGKQVFGRMVMGFGVLFLLFLMLKPREYEWTPTYAHGDDEPYGCQLFDSIVAGSMGGRYTVSGRSLYDLWADSLSGKPHGVLLLDFSNTGMLTKMARRGDHILIASDHFSPSLKEELGVYSHTYFDAVYYTRELNVPQKDMMTTVVSATDTMAARVERANYEVYTATCRSVLEIDSVEVPHRVLAWLSDSAGMKPIAVSFPMGKGELTLVSAPLLLTNFTMLHADNHELVMRLLSPLAACDSVVRLDPSLNAMDENRDLLDYILAQPPLRAAFWLILVGMVLFMLFTARRRQRIIPIVKEPANHSLEFVKLIGTLYYEQHDDGDLVRKKWLYTAERLRREAHVNISDARQDAYTAAVLSQQTGMSVDAMTARLGRLRRQWEQAASLTTVEARQFVDDMDEIIKQLSI